MKTLENGEKAQYDEAEAALEPPIVDTDLAHSTYVNGAVLVSFPSDVNADGRVGMLDIYEVGIAYSTEGDNLNWNANGDIDNKGTVNALDLSVINENYGKSNS